MFVITALRRGVEALMPSDPPACSAERIRVGTDVQSVAEVADAIARHGERYTDRIFTAHEVESCGGDASGLAARFAAKEAVIKVLRAGAEAPSWRSIEVRRQAGGWCLIALHDEAARIAERLDVRDLDVSLTHDAGIGAATVVALVGAR